MAAIPSTPNPPTGAQVQISAAQMLPQIGSGEIDLGQLLNLTVRSNPPGQDGLLFFKGQLFRATLPEFIQAGDKLLAQVLENNNQVVLKLLEITNSQTPQASTSSPSASTGISSQLAVELERLLKDSSLAALLRATNSQLPQTEQNILPFGLQPDSSAGPALPLPLDESSTSEIRAELQNLLSTIGSTETLSDSSVVSRQLTSLTDGSLASNLREAAKIIRSVLNEHTATPSDHFTAILQQELSQLIYSQGQTSAPPEHSATEIERLIKSISQEISAEKETTPKEKKELLHQVLSELKLAQENPSQQTSHLEAALSRLTSYAAQLNQTPQTLDPKTAAELQTLATRFEQMANIQEMLTQLNPIMQALGEPALILFPFVFQGLLSHSQIAIDPDAQRRQGQGQKQAPQKDSSEEKQQKKGSKGSSAYHRVQVCVPLPTMGTINVDVAHRDKEILLRLTVEDEDVRSFLETHLELLGSTLREQGFQVTECLAQLGKAKENLVSWTNTDSSDSLVVA